MTIKEVMIKGSSLLKSANIETPAAEAGVLLCEVIKKNKAYLYAYDNYELKEEEVSAYFDAIEKRREGLPLQYITGHQEFMSLDFIVSPSVLIPRADTEILVERVIDWVGECKKDRVSILDIGTGSGCIAVSLAYYLKDSLVTAVDICGDALKIARINAEKAGVEERVAFVGSNLFDALKGREKAFDVIVSNPPYIAGDEISGLQREVRLHEPMKALYGGEDGLDFYRSITEGAIKFLKPGGLLAFEVGHTQAYDVARLMENRFERIRVFKDLSQIDRVVMGVLK